MIVYVRIKIKHAIIIQMIFNLLLLPLFLFQTFCNEKSIAVMLSKDTFNIFVIPKIKYQTTSNSVTLYLFLIYPILSHHDGQSISLNFYQLEDFDFIIFLEYFEMKIIGRIKQLVRAADFFYSTEMLCYDQDLQYKKLTGGIISLAIIVTIFVGFANMILNTLNLNTFTISTQTIKNVVPPHSVLEISDSSTFRFAIEIWRHNLSDAKRYFDINFAQLTSNYGQVVNVTYIPLETCTKQYFKKYPQIVKNFDTLQSGKWLCPPLNTLLNIQGKYSSKTYKQTYLTVSACQNSTDPSRPCASPQQIQQYFTNNSNFFYSTVYFTNTQVNPDKKDYLQTYLQDESYAIFGSNLGSQVYLYFTDYTVSTDQSIWPFASIQTSQGCLVQQLAINHPFQTNINGSYITFSIAKSSNSIVYTREVQKLSAVFSFMGGMIGAVSAVLFVIKIYTSLSFEFSIAFEIFKKKTAQKIVENVGNPTSNQNCLVIEKTEHISMNFFNFIRYYFYTFCEKVGFSYSWPEMGYAKECKQQILKQLDIKLLLKRIIFIEHCLTYIIDDYQLDALQIKKPETPQQVREIRLKCESIVDRQLEEYEPVCTIQEAKEKTAFLEQNSIESPNLLETKPKLQLKKKSSSNQLQVARYSKGRDHVLYQMKDGVVVIDIESVRDEASSQLQQKIKNRNQIHNSQKREKTRKLFLMQLEANAKEGNSISSKIWKTLDDGTKKSIKCQ